MYFLYKRRKRIQFAGNIKLLNKTSFFAISFSSIRDSRNKSRQNLCNTKTKDSLEMISSILFMKKHKKAGSNRQTIANRLNSCSETVDFRAELKYTSNNNESIEVSHSPLEYSVPISISSKLFVHKNSLLLQIQILNCSYLSIKIIS